MQLTIEVDAEGPPKTIRTFSCQGLMPNGLRCRRYAPFVEEDGLNLCRWCHLKHKRSAHTKIKESIRDNY